MIARIPTYYITRENISTFAVNTSLRLNCSSELKYSVCVSIRVITIEFGHNNPYITTTVIANVIYSISTVLIVLAEPTFKLSYYNKFTKL